MRTPRLTLIIAAILAMGGMAVCACAAEYSDVPTWQWAWSYIQGVTDAGIAAGYGDGTYQPSTTVTRDQMAVFIARAMCGGDSGVPAGPAAATFPDVPATGYGDGGTDPYWAYKYVEYAVANHVVSGFDDGLYHPDWDVTRGQMAAFLARSMAGGDDSVPAPSGSPRFPDVTDTINSWCYNYVEYIADKGVTTGYPDGMYHPEIACSRDQMAAYLCRAFDLTMPAAPYNVTDYFPLGEGNTWIYETENGIRTKTISGSEALHGRTFARLLTQQTGAIDYWQAQPEGLYLGGTYDSETGTISFDPAFRIDNGLGIGQIVNEQESTVYNGTSQIGTGWFHFFFVDVEDVTVPAGTFHDCMKIQLQTQVMDQQDEQMTVWVAKGVGMVKLDTGEFGGDHWEVLVSANVGGTTYPADSGPFRLVDYRPIEVGSTLLYTGSDGTSLDQVVGIAAIGDEEAAQITRGPITIEPNREYFAVIDGALSYVGEYMSESDTLLRFSPPIAFPAAPSLGDYGSSTAQVWDGDTMAGTGTFEWALVDAGSLSTEAGDFSNCLKLRIAFTDPSSNRYESYTWLALGVGVVKEDARTFGGDYWRELTAAKVLGVEYPIGDRLFDITDYVDLTVGNEWAYDSGLPQVVTGIDSLGDFDFAVVGNPSAIDAPSAYLRSDADGLYYAGMLGGGFANPEFDPPLLTANGLVVGDGGGQTSSYFVNGDDLGDATFAYTFDGIEAVSTDAGLFPDSMKISYSLHLPTMATGAAQTETVWYARGVGVVKRDNGSVVSELTQASIAGVSYPPGDTAFTMTDYLPLEIDNQWSYMTQGESGYSASSVIVDGIEVVDALGITDDVYKLSRYEVNGYAGSNLMAVRDDGIAIYGYRDPSTGAMVVNPPIIIPNGAVVGDSGSGDSTAYTWATDHWQSAGTIHGTWELLDAGPVTTSAGRFDDGVLVRWSASGDAIGATTHYDWYARNAGIVKTYEVGQSQWTELVGASIGDVTVPEVLPNGIQVDASIPEGSGLGFDFSSGGAVASPDDQDLSYIYNTSQDASVRSFDLHGISKYVGQGEFGFSSLEVYGTFLPWSWDLQGEAWSQDSWVLGIGWDSLENSVLVKTREGGYALVAVTGISAGQLDITYIYPYGFYGQ